MATQADLQLPTAEDLAAIAELVWSSYVPGDLVPDAPATGAGVTFADQVTALVSIRGEWNGHVLIETGPATARSIAAAMFALADPDVGEAEVVDAFGELANIVGGNVKALLPEPSVLSLPQVELGQGSSVPPARPVARTDLHWDGRPVRIGVWSAA